MPKNITAKIKDRDLFKQVFPLPEPGIDDDSELAHFILSILDQTIQVQKLRSCTGSFYYISDIDPRWVIIPNWIASFETEDLLPTYTVFGNYVESLVLEDGTVIVAGR